ncbi:MAG TPA: NAD(P)-dependent oxidoreductase [Pyrinomonadaceae bacterium]|nr:NAD(P)-dependent oxidoreductase [Pyrinomonadaceae bacterium]
MTKTRELVLGGDGLIGSALVDALTKVGHPVTSLDLKSGCDLRQIDDKPFRACDRVWFLAWDTGGARYIEAVDRQHEQYKHNCELTVRVLDALARTRSPFLFVSSQLAGLPTAYGTTKLMAASWSLQLGGKVARLWNTYGWEHPDIRSHVVTDLVLSGLRRREVTCMTDGLERRRFVYKTDCVDALIKLFDGPKQFAEVAGPEWVTIRQVGEEIARQLSVEFKPGSATGSEVMVDPKELLPDWQPRVTLKEGIARVIADARAYLSQQKESS